MPIPCLLASLQELDRSGLGLHALTPCGSNRSLDSKCETCQFLYEKKTTENSHKKQRKHLRIPVFFLAKSRKTQATLKAPYGATFVFSGRFGPRVDVGLVMTAVLGQLGPSWGPAKTWVCVLGHFLLCALLFDTFWGFF